MFALEHRTIPARLRVTSRHEPRHRGILSCHIRDGFCFPVPLPYAVHGQQRADRQQFLEPSVFGTFRVPWDGLEGYRWPTVARRTRLIDLEPDGAALAG